jgi:hypothetical protein
MPRLRLASHVSSCVLLQNSEYELRDLRAKIGNASRVATVR